MTEDLLEQVVKKLEGLDADKWTADNYENPTSYTIISYTILIGRYHISPSFGFFVTVGKKEDSYNMKIRQSNDVEPITFGGFNSKSEEKEKIRSLFCNVHAKIGWYIKNRVELEGKKRILTELLKEFNLS